MSIKNLIAMRDYDGLYEVMRDSDDWLTQLDAAEGLVKLGDRRGINFLQDLLNSEYEDLSAAATELLDTPDARRLLETIAAEIRREYESKVKNARVRLQKGQKVFRYKVLYLPADEFQQDTTNGETFTIPDLDFAGLDGWEIVHILPRHSMRITSEMDPHVTGAYVLMQKEITPAETAELDTIP